LVGSLKFGFQQLPFLGKERGWGFGFNGRIIGKGLRKKRELIYFGLVPPFNWGLQGLKTG